MSDEQADSTQATLDQVRKNPLLYLILAVLLGSNGVDLFGFGPDRQIMAEQGEQIERIADSMESIDSRLTILDTQAQQHAERLTAAEIGLSIVEYKISTTFPTGATEPSSRGVGN